MEEGRPKQEAGKRRMEEGTTKQEEVVSKRWAGEEQGRRTMSWGSALRKAAVE